MTDLMNKTSAPVLEVKALKGKGEFEGYASTFGGDPDSYGDVIAKGAFTDSLTAHKAKGRLPKMLWQHDMADPIGVWTEMSEDDRGLQVKGRLTTSVPRAAAAYELLMDGALDGLSIGFRLEAYEVDEDEPDIWTLTRIDLKEVSIVTIGANENAVIEDVKTAKAADTRRRELIAKVGAGERLTEREFEDLAKGTWGLTNSQAERAARVHLKGQGEPAEAAELRALFAALAS